MTLSKFQTFLCGVAFLILSPLLLPLAAFAGAVLYTLFTVACLVCVASVTLKP